MRRGGTSSYLVFLLGKRSSEAFSKAAFYRSNKYSPCREWLLCLLCPLRYFFFWFSSSSSFMTWTRRGPSTLSLGDRRTNSRIGPPPMTLTISWPFQSSHTSWDVDDINSDSAIAQLSRALPIMALSHDGPPTRIAPTTAVITPNGAIARMKLSAQPIEIGS